jgi:hypothetical protein
MLVIALLAAAHGDGTHDARVAADYTAAGLANSGDDR